MTNETNNKVYLLTYETEIEGVFSSPEKLVRTIFGVDPSGLVDLEEKGVVSLKEAIKIMMDPYADYPRIEELTVDSDKVWSMDR